MMTRRHWLLGLASLLAVLAVIELAMPMGRPAAAVRAASIFKPSLVTAGAAAPTDPAPSIVTILARPLLRPDRRPIARPGRIATQRSLPRLSGILVDHGVKLAIFADPGGTTVMRAEGGTIGRYRVLHISETAVTLGVGVARIVLVPRFAKLDGSIAPPAAVAPLKLAMPGRE